MKLVGICGALRSGKSTASERLTEQHGYVRVSMADPIRGALMGMGAHSREVRELKMEPCELWGGRTSRFAMQTLGTEWGRNTVDPDIWVNCAKRRTLALAETNMPVVIDDIRFENEAQMIRDLGGVLIKVRRPEVEYGTLRQTLVKWFGWRWGSLMAWVHESELGWVLIRADKTFHNTTTVRNVRNFMDAVASAVSEGRKP